MVLPDSNLVCGMQALCRNELFVAASVPVQVAKPGARRFEA